MNLYTCIQTLLKRLAAANDRDGSDDSEDDSKIIHFSCIDSDDDSEVIHFSCIAHLSLQINVHTEAL